MTPEEFTEAVSGRLIVSCQAGPNHPLRDTATLVRVAQAAIAGGAAAIRCGGVGGVPDVAAIVAVASVPVIGLTKEGSAGVYITPTAAAAIAVLEAGAQVVAVDATARPRPDGRRFADTVRVVHDAGGLVMADIATAEEGIAAARAGADVIATTLSGYVAATAPPTDPDLTLVAALRSVLPDAVIVAEGRYHSPARAADALAAGATAVVVGTAITDPLWITSSFAQGLQARVTGEGTAR